MSNDKMKSKLCVLNGGGSKNEMAEALKNLTQSLPDYIEYLRVMAQLHRVKFDALKESGFNDEQALELCKVIQ